MRNSRYNLLTLSALAFGFASTAAAGPVLFIEDFEQYDASGGFAPLAAQSDWDTEWGDALIVSSENSIDGQSGRFVFSPPVTNPIYAMISPQFGPSFGRLEMDFVFNGGSPQILVYDTESLFLNTRIVFGSTGGDVFAGAGAIILVGQATPTPSGLELVETEATWALGELMRIGVETTAGGALRVYKNDELIFTGTDINRTLFGTSGRIGQFFISTAPDYNSGFGQPDGSGATFTIDNIVFRAASCPADLIGDGVVGAADLALLLSSWSACVEGLPCPGDLDGDGNVDARDLALMLSYWGPCPE